MTPTEILSEFIVRAKADNIDNAVREEAVKCVIDTLGTSIGAANDSEITGIYNTLLRYNELEKSTVWGKRTKASLMDAVLINAMMGHTLELDDVHKRSKCHAGTVVIPVAITLGEFLDRTGKEVLESVIVGYETMVRIGMGFGVTSHRLKGWHVTSTAGTFGAAATASKLFGLNKDEVTSALGLAGTQSSGVWAFTSGGATNKKFHPGHSATCGVMAALLAKSGMKGSANILDAEDGGLFYAMSDEYDYDVVTKGLGENYEFTDLDRKPYACCRSMHPPINAVLNIMDREKIDIDSIENIVVKTYKIAIKQCGFTCEPRNVAEAKFSLPYGIAVTLSDKQALPEQFTETRIKDKRVLKLAKKVSLVEDDEFTSLYPQKWGCELEIHMKNGSTFIEKVHNAKGDPINPLSKEEICGKFVRLVNPILGEDRTSAVLGHIIDLVATDRIARITSFLSKGV